MALQSSGAISFGQINTELGLSATAQISLNDSAVRTLLGVASGAISMSSAYGKSNLPSFAPFVGGSTGGAVTAYSTNDKYTFSNDTTALGTALPTNIQYAIGTGNASQFMIFNGGTNTRRLYSYSGDSWTTGTAFSPSAAFYGGMIGNSTVAINKNSGLVATTQKYTYATTVVSAGASLSYASNYGPGCIGNATQGIFCGGYTSAGPSPKTSSKYTYSNDTTAAGGNLAYTGMGCGTSSGAYFMPGIGISTVGIFTGGNDACMTTGTTATSVYTYSSDTQALGTNLRSAVTYSMTGGSTSAGIVAAGATNIQGAGVQIATSSKYTYSGSTVIAGGTLSQARMSGAGPGATPAAI